MTSENLKEGDIFRWRYKDEKPSDHGEYRRYHCKSRIAVFDGRSLRDTYWGETGYEGCLKLEDVVLEFQGNAHEMRQIPPGERVFYRYEDIMDMNHANNSRAAVYVKVGATRNPEAMKEYFEHQLDTANRSIEMGRRRISECKEALDAVARGELSGNFYVYS